MFALGELEADEAVQELQPLDLMTQPSVFEKTKRLMITDTVAKLQNVKMILEAFEPSTLDNGTVMKNFALQHVSAEDILSVARPHLGLATGEMIGIDVSISADVLGENIFVTGVEDKVVLIENLIQSLDRPDDSSLTTADGKMELQTHMVDGENAEMVYDVLVTLLAGKTLRLSVDEEAGTIVALADPQTQLEIAETVAQLQASEADFEVIPLKSADPYFVMTLLEEMLDLPDEYDDPDDIPADAPRIDADAGNRRLFVRAKPKQIDQIKRIVEGLDAGSSDATMPGGGNTIRMLPLSGPRAVGVLETAAKFWRLPNPIFLLPKMGDGSANTERVLSGLPRSETTSSKKPIRSMNEHLTSVPTGASDANETAIKLLTVSAINSQAPAIRCQLTPRGVLVQSDDVQALDALEEQVATIAGPAGSIPSPPIVFYLKYTKPDDALRMLAELLDGGESAKEGEIGTLVNGYVSSSSTFLGSIVTSRDGTLTMLADTMTVVADARLNRLIAQGTSSDIERIESYLKIIDKDRGIIDVQTYGSAHVVELLYTDATEVAETLRSAYAGRVASSNAGGANAAAQRGGEQQKGEEKSKKAPAKQSSQPVRNLEPQMTIAVHEPSNSLIVTAPDQLFAEVQELISQIDTRSEETLEVVTQANSTLLQSLLSPQSNRSRGSERSRGSSNSSREARSGIEALYRKFER